MNSGNDTSRTLTLGSLFSGSGGFELAGLLQGMIPVWASEIEPFCIRVTQKNLPFVKHYGDINKLSGSEIEPVDIITFGSPCQNLSLAGQRTGINGEQSRLFFEAVRVIKQMREVTNGKPRYIVWENVPGAFSSNKGEDFRCVLESICRIKDETVTVSMPENGKWSQAGKIVGDDYSVCWRVLDAQYFGVPQRRKRIFLVADFAGQRAERILFECEGLSRHFKTSCPAWQRASANTQGGVGAAGFDGYNGSVTDDVSATLGVNCGMSSGRNGVIEHSSICLNDQGGNRMDITDDVTSTLRAEAHHPPCVLSAGFCTEHSAYSRSIGYEAEISPTLRNDVVPAAVALEHHPQDSRIKIADADIAQSLTKQCGTGGNNVPLVMDGKKTYDVRLTSEGTKNVRSNVYETDTSRTVDTGGIKPDSNQGGVAVVQKAYGISSYESNAMKSQNPNSGVYEADTARTVDTSGENPTSHQGGMAVVCVDMGGGKSRCAVSDKLSPTLIRGHQGEPAVCVKEGVVSIEGNGSRPSHHGTGYSEGERMFTLNATEHHAVAYGIDRAAFNQGQNALYKPAVEEELQPTIVAKGPGAVACYSTSKNSHHTRAVSEITDTLVATDYKDPPTVSFGFYPQMKAECVTFSKDKSTCLVNGTNPGFQNGVIDTCYVVRRLTPTECARLQGFPDWWCDNLFIHEPTKADIDFWYDVFEEFRKATSSSAKPKSRAQIEKWLKKPHSDSAEYRMWGNGVALPCVAFVLAGIIEAECI